MDVILLDIEFQLCRRDSQLGFLGDSSVFSGGGLTLTRKLPRVSFHSLRHSHASALITAGLDELTIFRRLGHGSPVVTLGVYGHMFRDTGSAAANAIEAVLKR